MMEISEDLTSEEKVLALALQRQPVLQTPACYGEDDFIRMARGKLDASKRAPILAHMATCAYCRQEFRSAREGFKATQNVFSVRDALEQAPIHQAIPARRGAAERRLSDWRHLFFPGLGFALAAAAVACLYVTQARTLRQGRANAEVALREARQHGEQLKSERDDLRNKQANIELKWRQAVTQRDAEQVENNRLLQENKAYAADNASKARDSRKHPVGSLPTQIASNETRLDLSTSRVLQNNAPMRGNGTGNSASFVTLLFPTNEWIAEVRPTLRWKLVAGAKNYRVRIYDKSLSADSVPVSQNTLSEVEWMVSKPLRRGAKYRWTVTALFQEEAKEQGGSAEFAILDARKAIKLERAALAIYQSGIALANLGELSSAEQTLASVPPNSQAFPKARAALREIRDLRRSETK